MSKPETSTQRNILMIGLVSFFNDLSSEVIGRLLPIFLVVVSQASVMSVGLIEGVADATTVFARIAAGRLSDQWQKRKPLVIFGYFMSVACRPLILIFPFTNVIAITRFIDRLGKGIRTPARDALISDISNKQTRGAFFGINRFLDSLGASLGLSVVAYYLFQTQDSQTDALMKIMGVAAAVGFLALIVLIFGVKELSKKPVTKSSTQFGFVNLDVKLKKYLGVAFVFSLASSSDAFLILRAKDLGMTLAEICLLFAVWNILAAVGSYYLSALSDTKGRKVMLMWGWSVYVICYFGFGMESLTVQFFPFLMCFYSLFYAFTEGVEKALLADLSQPEMKAYSYGWLGLVNGLGLIPGNLIFSMIYERVGVSYSFWFSGALALLGVLLLSQFEFRGHDAR